MTIRMKIKRIENTPMNPSLKLLCAKIAPSNANIQTKQAKDIIIRNAVKFQCRFISATGFGTININPFSPKE